MPLAPMTIEQQLACWHNHTISCQLAGESRGRFAASVGQNGRHELYVSHWYNDPAGELYITAIRSNGSKVKIPFIDLIDVFIVPEPEPDKEPEFLDCTGPRVAKSVSQHLVAIGNVSTLSIDYSAVRPQPTPPPPPPLDNSPQLQPQPSPSTAASLTSTATTTPPSTAPAEVPGAAQPPAAGR